MLIKEMMRLKIKQVKPVRDYQCQESAEPGRTYLISLITADGITVPQS